mgnify:CR=1 FL=1
MPIRLLLESAMCLRLKHSFLGKEMEMGIIELILLRTHLVGFQKSFGFSEVNGLPT